MDSPTEPGKKKTIVEIYPNIYQIFGRNRSAHAYLIRGLHKNVLIDSCLPDACDHVVACLSEIELSPEDIDLVLLTHEHIDHAGCAPFFGRHALLAAHRLAANKLTMRDEFAMMNKAFGSVTDEFHLDIFLSEGVSINLGNYELHVIHTPGHCSGAVCFYEPNHRLLFTGDVVMAEGMVGGVLQSGNISDYVYSLKRLASFKVDHLYPGHGKISAHAESDIAKGIDRLETLLEESKLLFQVVQNSQHGFDQIVRSLRDLNR
ncbi:MBL fold metallo-hydrolase [Propionivibrio sp.]|uniref:MBL fold metallo-hydrolase n=1 Tax=Propionivibrio sp. TaxID=2212460 RepID=UPI003BF05076